jgi:flagellar M-ring protein FliF
MRNQVTGALARLQRTFASFTAGQKVTAVLGAAALLFAAVLTFQWASAPSYVPLFNNLAPADASAIVDQLESEGTAYELTDGGATILVPNEVVYDARIRLSGEGLPADDTSGYALLDDQGLDTSQFQEQTDFKRAMEGELADTIEALDGVDTAVVHLAMPQKEIFADEQEPTTASVLLGNQPGFTMAPEQVQAVVHLVSSSIEGLEPDNVTVADATGQVLSAPGDSFSAAADSQAQQVEAFEQRTSDSVQQMLDQVVGTGNSTVQVTAQLNFDKTVTNTTRYFADPETPPLAETSTTETYTAPGQTGPGGVVGPDGALDPTAGAAAGDGDTSYKKKSLTADNGVNKSVEQREAAPGSVGSLHVAIVMDTQAIGGIQADSVADLVSSGLGIDPKRGDTVEVQAMPFDRSAEEAAAAEIAAADAADQKAEMMSMARTGAVALLVLLLLVGAWLRNRKRTKARKEATTYVVEQLRQQSADRTERPALDAPTAAAAALASAPTAPAMPDTSAVVRDEIAALVERQPEEVAQLLRGWLVDHEVRP